MADKRFIPFEVRTLVLGVYNQSCAYCRGREHLQIHHIDKDPNNNAIGNLRLVCIIRGGGKLLAER